MSEASVVSRSFTVRLENGLHLRPWMQFVKLAHRYKAKIEVVKDFVRSDARSMLSLLALAAKQGDVIVVEAQGDDAAEAVSALVELLDGYDESKEAEVR